MSDTRNLDAARKEADESDGHLTEPRHGSRRYTRPTRGGMYATLELGERVSDDTNLTVNGYCYDDEPNVVELRLAGPASLTLSLTPTRARELAGDLLASARVTSAAESEVTRGL